MRGESPVAWTKEMRNAYAMLIGNLSYRVNIEDIGIYGRTILKWILKKQDVKM
jgi:hypothetical protein